MGSAMSCDTCPTAVTSSVVNLSDAVVLRVADGIEQPKSKQPEPVSMEDQGWFEKLKCIDDAHSQKYGLFIKDMERMISSLEKRSKEGIVPEACFMEYLKSCYQTNTNCTLKCVQECQEFIDCLDTKRLEKIKLQVLKERQNKLLKKKTCH